MPYKKSTFFPILLYATQNLTFPFSKHPESPQSHESDMAAIKSTALHPYPKPYIWQSSRVPAEYEEHFLQNQDNQKPEYSPDQPIRS